MRIEYFVADNWLTDEWRTFYLESELKKYENYGVMAFASTQIRNYTTNTNFDYSTPPSPLSRYTLRLSGYFGDSGYDIMSRTDFGGVFMQNNMPFSTIDKDSTGLIKCCSVFQTAGWFSSCCHIDFFGSPIGFDTFAFNDWFQIQALRMSIRQY
ncbi:hypothetical protein HELRODRAFT_182856 [Helobdella robusta]|uniref:Fibrinogen C-terminal domain-containing protein n=1 Tax=Helobdella robusta TaxID=6412 RepID=T1FIV5_HELRO|nr:hypothetical protein HELRODRAFT_182856 [Helobdella robusta]ESN90064.1 hypothetical protein HELRODRAFT_182856 [Helobdella robusta]